MNGCEEIFTPISPLKTDKNAVKPPERNVQIRQRYSDDVLFEGDYPSVKMAVAAAVREDVSLENADLREADLMGAGLEGARLEGARLEGADLRGARLGRARLRGAHLGSADLEGALLKDADLGDADLRGANLGRANLQGAYLRGIDLRGAYLGGADLTDADLGGARFRGSYIRGAGLIDAGQDSRGWRFIGCRFNGGVWVAAGCRWLSLSDARSHWGEGYPHDASGMHHGDRVEINAKLDLIEATAKSRGWYANRAKRIHPQTTGHDGHPVVCVHGVHTRERCAECEAL